jgi:hypothetical protein
MKTFKSIQTNVVSLSAWRKRVELSNLVEIRNSILNNGSDLSDLEIKVFDEAELNALEELNF